MATITLAADTTYSTLTVANNDIIDLAGYKLSILAQPAETSIEVISPSTAGTVSIVTGFGQPGYDLSTWSMTAGTAQLIATIPSGTELDSLTGGSATNAYGCSTNNGTITTCTGGSGTNARGCNSNYGTVTTCTGGTGTNAYGCRINYATITTCTGGSVSGAHGCSTNYATILKAFDGVERAINISYGDSKFVIGPDFQTTISNPSGDITTIYSIGELSGLATIPVGVTVITLSMGAGGGLMKIGQGGGYNG